MQIEARNSLSSLKSVKRLLRPEPVKMGGIVWHALNNGCHSSSSKLQALRSAKFRENKLVSHIVRFGFFKESELKITRNSMLIN
jgi:hypothetical protein